MADTKYFLRKKSMDYIEHRLKEQLDLELCFKDKRERIFKNEEVLITCKGQYISILYYDDNKKDEVQKIVSMIS